MEVSIAEKAARIRDATVAALGGLAIAFQVATMPFLALLFTLILVAVIDKLDFSFWD